jgi:quercetin dioxygenase-like cupin family protein
MLTIITAALVSCMGNKANQSKNGDLQNDVNLDSIQLFLEYEKTEAIKVSENVSRKLIYLNDLMMVVVDFENGPMSEPDPVHSHLAEQTSYVAEGEVLVTIADKQKHLKAGDIFVVPSFVPHTVQSLTPKLRLVDCFNPIREDFIKK